MALYDRFRGHDDDGADVPKLPIWPTITTVAEILSGEITEAGSDMVVRVVCEDQPVNADELTLLRVGLDAIDRVYFGRKKPGG